MCCLLPIEANKDKYYTVAIDVATVAFLRHAWAPRDFSVNVHEDSVIIHGPGRTIGLAADNKLFNDETLNVVNVCFSRRHGRKQRAQSFVSPSTPSTAGRR